MSKQDVLDRLKASEAELRGLGVDGLSLFGSVARGQDGKNSDVDLLARFSRARPFGLFKYAVVADRLEQLLGRSVDLVEEPVSNRRLQAAIDRDRVHVF